MVKDSYGCWVSGKLVGIAILLLAALAQPAGAQNIQFLEDDDVPVLVQEAVQVGYLDMAPITPEATLLLASIRLAGTYPEANEAILLQEGQRNTALIEQAGIGNSAIMVQQGADIYQTIQQLGDRNLFGSWIVGDNNRFELVQQGNDNVYLLDFTGTGLDPGHVVEQIGNGNVAIQMGVGEPFGIQQNGDGMQIIISHN